MKCSCGFVNRDGAKFCKRCGAHIESRRCRRCGADNCADSRYCKQCGAEIGMRVSCIALVVSEPVAVVKLRRVMGVKGELQVQMRYLPLFKIGARYFDGVHGMQIKIPQHIAVMSVPERDIQNTIIPADKRTMAVMAEYATACEERKIETVLLPVWECDKHLICGVRGTPIW